MRTLLIVLVAVAGPARAQAPGGTIRSDRGTVEILPPRAGSAEIRTPEGFIRAEGPTPAVGATGSFGVYTAGAYGRAAPPPGAVAAGPSLGEGQQVGLGPWGEAPARRTPDPCRNERRRYVVRLLHMAGIDVEDPLAFLEGLAGPAAYPGALLFSAYGLLPGVDPIRPLAFDFELQRLARELARCAKGGDT